MDVGWIMGGFFVLLIILYAVVALLAPEWVGIQGKVAKQIEDSHKHSGGESPKDDSKT